MLIALILLAVLVVLLILYFLLSLFVTKVLGNNTGLLARILSALLVLQYILGMLANLYGQIPQQKPYEVFHMLGYTSLHSINGTLLLLLSVIFLVQEHKAKSSPIIAFGGIIGIVIAFASGIIFVNFGQNNIFSFIMSLGFLLAFISYSFKAFSYLLQIRKKV